MDIDLEHIEIPLPANAANNIAVMIELLGIWIVRDAIGDSTSNDDTSEKQQAERNTA